MRKLRAQATVADVVLAAGGVLNLVGLALLLSGSFEGSSALIGSGFILGLIGAVLEFVGIRAKVGAYP